MFEILNYDNICRCSHCLFESVASSATEWSTACGSRAASCDSSSYSSTSVILSCLLSIALAMAIYLILLIIVYSYTSPQFTGICAARMSFGIKIFI